jgi:CheY-like chemotaxis protein
MRCADEIPGEFVLVIEEDPLLLATTRSVLCQNGYDVVTSSTPEQALSFCQRRPLARVAICDVVFPGGRMNGIEIARRLHAMTGTRTILTCRHHRVMLGHIAGFDAYPFLAQPVAPKQLLTAVAEGWRSAGQARERIA